MTISRPPATVIPGSTGQDLLRRVLRVRSDMKRIARIDLVDDERWQIRLLDAGSGETSSTTARPTAIHVLWARDEDRAALEAAGKRHPVAPGDTLLLPPGTPWRPSAGLVLCEIAGPASGQGSASIVGPTHGEETFHGFNRRTTYPSPPGLQVERWKVTQPLILPSASDACAIVDLATPVALAWREGTDLLERGTLRIVAAHSGPVTILPDGLGYVLIVYCLPRPHMPEGKT